MKVLRVADSRRAAACNSLGRKPLLLYTSRPEGSGTRQARAERSATLGRRTPCSQALKGRNNMLVGRRPICFALSGLSRSSPSNPGRRCALPWPDMSQPLRGESGRQTYAKQQGRQFQDQLSQGGKPRRAFGALGLGSVTVPGARAPGYHLSSLRDCVSRRTCLQQMLGAAAFGFVPRNLQGQPTSPKRKAPASNYFTPKTRNAIDAGLAYLASRQAEDGAFGSGVYQNNLAVCGLAGMAFLSSGYLPGRGKYGDNLDRCIGYVLANCQESGFIHAGQMQTRGPMYEHGFATLFLAEVYGNTSEQQLREKLVKAVQLIVNTQNDQGGWRYKAQRGEDDLSVTVCQVMALRAAHNAGVYVPADTIERAVAYVKRCQNEDGGFRYVVATVGESAFPRSAAAVVALYSAGIYEGQELADGLNYLMQFPPGANNRGERSYYFYGHYYAVQAMWHAGGRNWDAWYPAIRDTLLAQQRRDGAWVDAISSDYGTAMACLILQMPESYLPIFER
ncbi:MAG: prenyltransferase [Planctomycetaceae bacterium]|nr:prenyltransferase [Planctomycetaceae bacterium]